MSADCVSSADNLACGMITARSVANAKPAIVFMLRVLLPAFVVASRLAELAKLLRCFDVAPRPTRYVLLFVERQLPANFRWRSEHQGTGRNFHPASDKRICADDGARTDFDIVEK